MRCADLYIFQSVIVIDTDSQGDLVLLMLAVKLVYLGDEDNPTAEHQSDVLAAPYC